MYVATDRLESDSESERKSTILIAEDNDDVRLFLVDTLKPKYDVIEFSSGLNALSSREREIPDPDHQLYFDARYKCSGFMQVS